MKIPGHGIVAPLALIISVMAATTPALAQTIPNTPQPAPGDAFALTIEAASPSLKSAGKSAGKSWSGDSPRFVLHDLKITGASAFTESELKPLFAASLGKETTLSGVAGIAESIEAKYRGAGYVLSSAIVPPQRIADGIVTIAVTEGFIAAATVEGGSPEAGAAIRAVLGPVMQERPLKAGTMERAIQSVRGIMGRTAASFLRPAADAPGAFDLTVTPENAEASGGFFRHLWPWSSAPEPDEAVNASGADAALETPGDDQRVFSDDLAEILASPLKNPLPSHDQPAGRKTRTIVQGVKLILSENTEPKAIGEDLPKPIGEDLPKPTGEDFSNWGKQGAE